VTSSRPPVWTAARPAPSKHQSAANGRRQDARPVHRRCGRCGR
jgi:hypothetical protein